MNFMRPQQLDFIFPFILFFYGALLTIVLNQKYLMSLMNPDRGKQMERHRVMAFVALIVGFLWSLQELWLS